MKKLVIISIAFTVAILASYIGWKIVFPSYTLFYKMTVSVDTPEGIKSGWAVRRVGLFQDIKVGDHGGGGGGVTGEAVIVDLGQKGKLFAIIGNDYAYQLLFRAFPSNAPPLSREGMEYYANLKEGKASLLSLDFLPRFIRFRDLNDPMTVSEVEPLRLEAAYGSGYALRDVTVEISEEPITRQIYNVLPWLEGLHGGYLHGDLTSRGAPLGLDAGQFVSGRME